MLTLAGSGIGRARDIEARSYPGSESPPTSPQPRPCRVSCSRLQLKPLPRVARRGRGRPDAARRHLPPAHTRTVAPYAARRAGRTTWYETVEEMQTDLEAYLETYQPEAAAPHPRPWRATRRTRFFPSRSAGRQEGRDGQQEKPKTRQPRRSSGEIRVSGDYHPCTRRKWIPLACLHRHPAQTIGDMRQQYRRRGTS